MATWMARHQAINARAKQGHIDLIYVGDSIVQNYATQGKDTWDRYYAPRNALNLGMSGDRTEHVLWRLDHGNIDGIAPKLAIVMIGQNNGGHNTAEEIGAGVIAVVQKIRAKLPTTKILLLAIFPRRAKPTEEREVLKRNMVLGVRREDKGAIARTEFDVLEGSPVGSAEQLATAMEALQRIHVSEALVRLLLKAAQDNLFHVRRQFRPRFAQRDRRFVSVRQEHLHRRLARERRLP